MLPSSLTVRLTEAAPLDRIKALCRTAGGAQLEAAISENGHVPFAAFESDDVDASLLSKQTLLQELWSSRFIELASAPHEPEAVAAPLASAATLRVPIVEPESLWRTSRFAYSHRDGDTSVIDTPRTTVRIRARGPLPHIALHQFTHAASLEALRGYARSAEEAVALVQLLCAAGVIDPVALNSTAEERNAALEQWEFHDLLFHARSRLGRHDAPSGAQYPFRGRFPHTPPTKANIWAAATILLPRPSIEALAGTDMSLSQALEKRRSERRHHDNPLHVAELGHFLFRAARIRSRFSTEFGEFTSRPYPSGGASYELELYLSVNACEGVPRGFYYYDPEAHGLSLVATPGADMDGLLDDARRSSAAEARPQVLITIASRFSRVNWKYRSIAYATQLKNVGVLYQTLYLVATAMGLSACGLGIGDAERFCRLSGTPFFEESSVGEFMIGSSATGDGVNTWL